MAQQECDAVNFLAKNPSIRPKFIIDKKNDPLLTGSANTIKNPGSTPGSSNQQCHVETVTTPATYKTESCEQSVVTQSFTCQKTLIPQCAYTGSPISSSSTSQTGIFPSLSITPTGTAGLYNYIVSLPNCTGGAEGSAQINFNLDTVGQGGYITINLSNLDDAAAIGVNGYAVFAGYPNAGPYYSGSYFPQPRHSRLDIHGLSKWVLLARPTIGTATARPASRTTSSSMRTPSCWISALAAIRLPHKANSVIAILIAGLVPHRRTTRPTT
jgi:hypothetical protein